MVAFSTYTSLATLGMMAYLSDTADAHQLVLIPKPTFTTNSKDTNWSPLSFLENEGVKVGPDALGYVKSKAKTLREFMDNPANFKVTAPGATFECGYTDPNGQRQPIPANGMMRSTGYSHEGPCEIWIDDTMVKSGDNCHFDIGATATSYKIDFSVCKGNCMIRWYWFGNRLINEKKRSWQIYKECIPIYASYGGGNDGDGKTRAADNTTTTATEKPTTAPKEKATTPLTEKPTEKSDNKRPSKCKVKMD